MKTMAYRNCLLTVLLITLGFNYVDRQFLGLVLQDIKADFSLSDTQLGLLTGITFALFYSTAGIPIARWADRGNRVKIISLAVALWSTAVALCGLATSFVQLLLIRTCVAVGEAGCIPPAQSLIADYFTRDERPRALAIYMLGGPASVVVGYFLAGWLNEFYGWRITFILIGLPGIALAAWVWLGLKEPRFAPRPAKISDEPVSALAGRLPPVQPQPSMKEVCVTLWKSSTFRHLLIGFSVVSFFNWGIGQWQAAFFVRSFGLQTGELGTWFALIYGVGGVLGTYWGGNWASRYAASNERLQLRAIALAYVGFGGVSVGTYLAPQLYVSFGLLGLGVLGGSAVFGPLFATIQTIVPDRMRALAIALIYLFSNLVGIGLGPLLVGAISDAFQSSHGTESLRYSMLAMCPGYLWGAWHLYWGSRTVMQDLGNDTHPQGTSAYVGHTERPIRS
jgi:MFS family permease